MNDTVILGTEPLPEEKLPKTFRIFAPGWNHTSKGKWMRWAYSRNCGQMISYDSPRRRREHALL